MCWSHTVTVTHELTHGACQMEQLVLLRSECKSFTLLSSKKLRVLAERAWALWDLCTPHRGPQEDMGKPCRLAPCSCTEVRRPTTSSEKVL